MICPQCRREIGLPPCTCQCGAVLKACPNCNGQGIIKTGQKRP